MSSSAFNEDEKSQREFLDPNGNDVETVQEDGNNIENRGKLDLVNKLKLKVNQVETKEQAPKVEISHNGNLKTSQGKDDTGPFYTEAEMKELEEFKKWKESKSTAPQEESEADIDPNLEDEWDDPKEESAEAEDEPVKEEDIFGSEEEQSEDKPLPKVDDLRLDESKFEDFDTAKARLKAAQIERESDKDEFLDVVNKDTIEQPSSTEIETPMDDLDDIMEDNSATLSENATIEIPKSKFYVSSEDLSSIVIKDKATFSDTAALKRNRPKRVSSTIVLPQSGYSCQISAITNREIQIINESVNTTYEENDKNFRIVHSKIESMPFGDVKYEDWLKITSFFDLDTLFYAIYCQTFPYKNTYRLTCPDDHCRYNFEVTLEHGNLVMIKDEKYRDQINKILTNVKTLNDLTQYSLLTKTKRIQLPESGDVVDFKIPSLYQYLNQSGKLLTDKLIKTYSMDSIIAISFLRNFLVPDSYMYENEGKLSFIPIVEKEEQLLQLNEFSPVDATFFTTELTSFVEQYKVDYGIRKVKCPKCGRIIENIPIDFQSLLFLGLQNLRNQFRKGK